MKLIAVWVGKGRRDDLSVSSNGSNWVKQCEIHQSIDMFSPFSILERIELGETADGLARANAFGFAFSILERIELGETAVTFL